MRKTLSENTTILSTRPTHKLSILELENIENRASSTNRTEYNSISATNKVYQGAETNTGLSAYSCIFTARLRFWNQDLCLRVNSFIIDMQSTISKRVVYANRCGFFIFVTGSACMNLGVLKPRIKVSRRDSKQMQTRECRR